MVYIAGIDEIEEFVNMPDALPNVAPGCVTVDMSSFYKNLGNVALGTGHVLVLFGYRGHGYYEAHVFTTPEARGSMALDRCRSIISHLFTYFPADAIVGEIPRDFRAARVFTRRLCFKPVGTSHDTTGRECVVSLLRRDEWETSSAGPLAVSEA